MIELWFLLGIDKIYMDDDGWMLCLCDGLCGVYSEYIIVVIDDGLFVLSVCVLVF